MLLGDLNLMQRQLESSHTVLMDVNKDYQAIQRTIDNHTRKLNKITGHGE